MSDAPRGITFQPDLYPRVLGLLPATPGARLLDVGAGEGYFSRLARERGFEVEACDYREDAFRAPEIPFHRADLAEGIPLPDASYDLAVSIEVIEHVENHARFVAEMCRVVRPGGLVIVTTPNVLSLPSRWHFFLYGFTDCAPRPLDPFAPEPFLQHVNPVSLPELLFHLERGGGELVRLATNRFRRGAWVPAALLYPWLALALRAKLLRRSYATMRPVYRRHVRWLLRPASLLGRITIAVARRCAPGERPA